MKRFAALTVVAATLLVGIAGCRTSSGTRTAREAATIVASLGPQPAGAKSEVKRATASSSSDGVKTAVYQQTDNVLRSPTAEELPGGSTSKPTEAPKERTAPKAETIEPPLSPADPTRPANKNWPASGSKPVFDAAKGETSGLDAPEILDVVSSVRTHFPTVLAAQDARVIASGEALSATGAFDRKLEGFNNIQPSDFFENHWYQWSLKRDTLWGGQIGASYKLGRGTFEPWYLERETNDLGEFGITVVKPFGRDIEIDANRAALWRAQLERRRVEPEIRAQLIQSVRKGVGAYWDWIAAGEGVRIAQSILDLGLERVTYLERQIELEEKAEIDLVDNRRVIVSRQAKLIDAQRKLRQTTIKLGLFLRTPSGQPVLLPADVMPPRFADVALLSDEQFVGDSAFAVSNRPELSELTILRRQLGIDMRQAHNETRPEVDGGLFLGQDVGNPTASDNKSEFEVEATLQVSVPLERRKAFGKIRQLRGKISQVVTKTRFTQEKISGEVLVTRTALIAAAKRVEQTTEGVDLTNRVRDAEQKLYEEGQSTLFNLNLREQQAAEAALSRMNAQLDYYHALSDYAAALGLADSSLFNGPFDGFDTTRGVDTREDLNVGEDDELEIPGF